MTPEFSRRCQLATEAALSQGFLHQFLPGAVRAGVELRAGDWWGGPGQSFSVNLKTGRWADFALAGCRGGDLVSLVAAREKVGQKEALTYLERAVGLGGDFKRSGREFEKTGPARLDAARSGQLEPDQPAAAPAGLPQKPSRAYPPAPANGPPTRVWTYTDAEGQPLYQALRWEKPGHRKTCRIKGLTDSGEKVPLYLPEIIQAARSGQVVYITEGEPKADLLRSWNFFATTFMGGAAGYREEMAPWFLGAEVVVVVDSDAPGRKFGRRVAASLGRAGKRPVKILELPGATFMGYDLMDWVRAGGQAADFQKLVASAGIFTPETGAAPRDAPRPEGWAKIFTPEKNGAGPPGRPLLINPHNFTALQDLEERREDYKWLLKGSLRQGQLGLVCGPPGAGKGMFCLQLAVALASGRDLFDFWRVEEPRRVLYLSAEDDEITLHKRLHQVLSGLPEEERRLAAGRLARVAVRGAVSLCRASGSSGAEPTSNLDDLRAMIRAWPPDLVILDTLARFFGVDENNNLAVTLVCAHLEEIMEEEGCGFLLVHHVNKHKGSDLAADKGQLLTALTQTAVRGASALVGAARWALVLAPLAKGLAGRILGTAAAAEPHGTCVAARVAKKNAGAAETECYLRRGQAGLLSRTGAEERVDEEAAVAADGQILAREVAALAAKNEPLPTETGAGRVTLGWGYGRTKKAVAWAVANNLLIKIKLKSRRGFVLAPQGWEGQDE